MGVDKTGVDKMGVDKMGVDEMGVDEMGVDEMGRHHSFASINLFSKQTYNMQQKSDDAKVHHDWVKRVNLQTYTP